MSTHTAGSNNPIDVAQGDNESDTVNRLIEIIHGLLRENEQLRDHVENLEQREQIQDSRLDAMSDAIDRIEDEDDSSGDESGDMDGEEGEAAAAQIAQTPLERTTVLPEDFCDYVNDRRARHLAMDLKQYARSAKSGYILEPSDIADILYSREQSPVAAHDETVARVREILDDTGGDEVQVIDRGRKKIVHFTEEIVSRLTNLGKLRDRCPSLVSSDVCDSKSGGRG